jgi:hypothetical protein
MRIMTILEFCDAAGICRATLQQWIEAGYLRAENIGLPGGGVRRVFDAGQLERAQLLKALLRKGVSLGPDRGRRLGVRRPGVRRLRWLRAARLPGCGGGDRRGSEGQTAVRGGGSGDDSAHFTGH